MNTYLTEMERLENKEGLKIEDIEELETKIKKANLEENIEVFLNNRIIKLKRKITHKQKTRWDLFVDEIIELQNDDNYENIQELINLVLEIDEVKDTTIDVKLLNKFETTYKKVLVVLHDTDSFSIYFRDRYIREINKKIKVFQNRLDKIINPEFGIKIRELREEKKMSLKELENISGVTSSYIHRIERGLRKPSVEKVKKLAYGLGADYKEFLSMLNMDSILEYEEDNFTVKDKNIERTYDLIDLIENNKIVINGHEINEDKKQLLLNMIENMSKLM